MAVTAGKNALKFAVGVRMVKPDAEKVFHAESLFDQVVEFE